MPKLQSTKINWQDLITFLGPLGNVLPSFYVAESQIVFKFLPIMKYDTSSAALLGVLRNLKLDQNLQWNNTIWVTVVHLDQAAQPPSTQPSFSNITLSAGDISACLRSADQ